MKKYEKNIFEQAENIQVLEKKMKLANQNILNSNNDKISIQLSRDEKVSNLEKQNVWIFS